MKEQGKGQEFYVGAERGDEERAPLPVSQQNDTMFGLERAERLHAIQNQSYCRDGGRKERIMGTIILLIEM